ATFFHGRDGQLFRLGLRLAGLHAAREDSDDRGAEDLGPVNPLLNSRDLTVSWFARRQAEIVADSRTGVGPPAAKRFVLERPQILGGDRRGEIIRSEFRPLESKPGTVVNEIDQRELWWLAG